MDKSLISTINNAHEPKRVKVLLVSGRSPFSLYDENGVATIVKEPREIVAAKIGSYLDEGYRVTVRGAVEDGHIPWPRDVVYFQDVAGDYPELM